MLVIIYYLELILRQTIWAASWQNLFMLYATNIDADQPAHPHSLINAFVVRCLDRTTSINLLNTKFQDHLASVTEQAGLSLTWTQTPKTDFFSWRGSYCLAYPDGNFRVTDRVKEMSSYTGDVRRLSCMTSVPLIFWHHFRQNIST